MPKYLTFFSYTSDAAKALIQPQRSRRRREGARRVGGWQPRVVLLDAGESRRLLHHGGPRWRGTRGSRPAAVSTGSISGIETHEIFEHDAQADIVKNAAKAVGASDVPPTDADPADLR